MLHPFVKYGIGSDMSDVDLNSFERTNEFHNENA